MSKQAQKTEAQAEKKPQHRVKPPVIEGVGGVAELIQGSDFAFRGGSAEAQAEALGRLNGVQRQEVVRRIAKVQGNLHVQRVIAAYYEARDSDGGDGKVLSFPAPAIQPKLTVGEPDDLYEQEADEVAETVMRMPAAAPPPPPAEDDGGDGSSPHVRTAGHISTAPADGAGAPAPISGGVVARAPEEEYEEEEAGEAVMRFPVAAPPPPPDDAPGGEDGGDGAGSGTSPRPSGPGGPVALRAGGAGVPEVTPGLETRIQGMRGTGRPLPHTEKAFFEDRFGADFGGVRVHTSDAAAQTARDLGARAYTVGSDVAFGTGEYEPGSGRGRRLLAHELAHVVQQGGAAQRKPEDTIRRQGGPEEVPGEETEGPTPEEREAAMAAAEAARAAAEEARQRGHGQEASSRDAGAAEQAAGEAPKQAAAESRGRGPVSDEVERSRQGAVTEGTQVAAEVKATRQADARTVKEAAVQQAAEKKQEAQQRGEAVAAPQQAAASSGAGGMAAGAGAGAAAAGAAGPEGAQAMAAATVEQAMTQEGGADSAPKSAAEDPAYGRVEQAAQTAAEEEQVHGPAAGAADAAQAAAESPESEVESQAQTAQVGEMEQAETPGFDAAAFKARLMERIAELTPSTMEGADEFKESGGASSVSGAMQGPLDQTREASETPLEEEVAAAPDTGAVTPKEVTPLEANDPGELAGAIEAEGAVPKPKGQSEFEQPLAESSAALDAEMEAAQITEEQLARSNEPEFIGALEAKGEAQAAAAEAPAEYRREEQGQIAGAEAEAVAAAQESLQGMHDGRAEAFGEVDQQQAETKTEDEAARERIANDIQAIYEETRGKVEGILERLDGEVNRVFDAGAEKARQTFESYVDARMEAYKQERYGGWLGWAQWLVDKVLGMPGEVNGFYQEGRNLYLSEMDAVIDQVVEIISTTLAEAKAEVANGKQRIQKYVDQLPDELREVGVQAAEAIQCRFDMLEETIDAKQDELIDMLANKYVENLEALDARIEELKAANRGLIDYAIDAIGGVIQTILELRDMLLGLLSRAQAAVEMILEDPMQFLANLIEAIKQGFLQFVGNIWEHLKAGFIDWLTGSLSGAGIQLPTTWDLKGILSLVLQILGLTWENVRSRAVGIFGEPVVAALETGFEIFVIVRDQGLPGLWEWIKDKIGDLKAQALDAIKEMIITEVIEAGITWLIGVLGGPAGAFIKACKAIYDIVVWFVNNAERLFALANAIIDSVVAIASGDLGSAANFVEETLARFIPTVIGFLAGLLGLGDLSAKVRRILEKIRKPINTAIDFVLNLVKGFVMKIAKLLGFGGGEASEGAQTETGGQIGKEVTFSAGEESYRLYVAPQGELMLAGGGGEGTLAGKLSQVGSAVGEMTGEGQGKAQGYLAQAQELEGSAGAKAASLAQKMQEVKTEADGDPMATEQADLEADEDALGGVLPRLFEAVGSPDVAEALAAIDREEQRFLEMGAIELEEAEQVAAAVQGQYPVLQSITVIDAGARWDYEYVVQREVKGGERKEGAYGSYLSESGRIGGSFSHPKWAWDGYPPQTVDKHPANERFGNHNGRVPDLTGGYELTGEPTPGSPHRGPWREEIDAKKGRYKDQLERIRRENQSEPKQAVLEHLGLAGDSRWQGKSLAEVLEQGARTQVERELSGSRSGVEYDAIWLIGWSEHHIQPVSFGGANTSSNLIFLPDSHHQSFTSWWNSRKSKLEGSFGMGGRQGWMRGG